MTALVWTLHPLMLNVVKGQLTSYTATICFAPNRHILEKLYPNGKMVNGMVLEIPWPQVLIQAWGINWVLTMF